MASPDTSLAHPVEAESESRERCQFDGGQRHHMFATGAPKKQRKSQQNTGRYDQGIPLAYSFEV